MWRILYAAPVCALAAVLAFNAAADEEVIRDGVKYVSGGVGTDSQERLDSRVKEFNLKLVFTLHEGNYLADVGVAIKDAEGRSVVEHLADGPIFLAKLPAGIYTANVSYNGKAQARKIRVGERLRTEYFRWPATPEIDFPLSREQAEEAKPRSGPKRG